MFYFVELLVGKANPPLAELGAAVLDAARWLIAEGLGDAAAFGRPYIANPDLVERFRRQAPLNEPDPATFYGGGAEGYTDYPSLEQVEDPLPA